MKKIKKITINTPYNNKCFGCNVCCRDEIIPLSLVDLYRLKLFAHLSYKECLSSYCDIATHTATGLPVAVLKKKSKGSCIFKSGILCLLGDKKPKACLIHPLKRVSNEINEAQYIKKNINCRIANNNIDTITTLDYALKKSSDIDIKKYTIIWNRQMHLLAYEIVGNFLEFKKRMPSKQRNKLDYILIDILYSISGEHEIDKQMEINFRTATDLLLSIDNKKK